MVITSLSIRRTASGLQNVKQMEFCTHITVESYKCLKIEVTIQEKLMGSTHAFNM
jgi:hypothetical protein